MPFVSQSDKKAFDVKLQQGEFEPESTFGESFNAAFTLAVDEELSISSQLNRQMYEERRLQTRKLIEQGLIDRAKYEDSAGQFDFNRAAKDLREQYKGMGRPGEVETMLKTDDELRLERNEMLRKRRESSQDILRRGSGLAQFLGTGSALIADPVNVASMGLGLLYGVTKGTTIVGRALYTARTEAAIAAAAETAIQPFVFAHKNDIESPYSVEEAITNIGIATGFGGAIGLVAGGVSGYFRNARDKSRQALVAREPGEVVPEGEFDVEAEFNRTYAMMQEAQRDINNLRGARDDWVEEQRERYERGEITEEEYKTLASEGEPAVAYKEARDRYETLDRQLDEIVKQDVQARRPDIDADELTLSFELMRRVDDLIAQSRESGLRDPADIYSREYQRYLDGETATLQEVNANTIADLEKKVTQVEKKNTKLRQWIKERGGLNMQAWKAEGIDEANFRPKEGRFPPGFWRKGEPKSNEFGRPVNGLRPSDLNEILLEDPSVAFDARINARGPDTWTDNDTLEWLLQRLDDPEARVYDELTAEADGLRRSIDELRQADLTEEALEKIYKDKAARSLELDIEDLRELTRAEERMNQPTRVPEDYEPLPTKVDREETNVQIKSTEREVLVAQGLSEEHDEIMALYRQLSEEDRKVTFTTPDGDEVVVDDFIQGLERDLEALDELIRCTRSA